MVEVETCTLTVCRILFSEGNSSDPLNINITNTNNEVGLIMWCCVVFYRVLNSNFNSNFYVFACCRNNVLVLAKTDLLVQYWPQYIHIINRVNRQTGHRYCSIGRTVTSNGHPKSMVLGLCGGVYYRTSNTNTLLPYCHSACQCGSSAVLDEHSTN